MVRAFTLKSTSKEEKIMNRIVTSAIALLLSATFAASGTLEDR